MLNRKLSFHKKLQKRYTFREIGIYQKSKEIFFWSVWRFLCPPFCQVLFIVNLHRCETISFSLSPFATRNISPFIFCLSFLIACIVESPYIMPKWMEHFRCLQSSISLTYLKSRSSEFRLFLQKFNFASCTTKRR